MTVAERHLIIKPWGDLMLDKEDLQAIAELMDAKIKESEKRIMQGAVALIDAEVKPMFGSLSDEISIVREKVENFESIDQMEDEIFALKAVVKQHTREINQLKKAQ